MALYHRIPITKQCLRKGGISLDRLERFSCVVRRPSSRVSSYGILSDVILGKTLVFLVKHAPEDEDVTLHRIHQKNFV